MRGDFDVQAVKILGKTLVILDGSTQTVLNKRELRTEREKKKNRCLVCTPWNKMVMVFVSRLVAPKFKPKKKALMLNNMLFIKL